MRKILVTIPMEEKHKKEINISKGILIKILLII